LPQKAAPESPAKSACGARAVTIPFALPEPITGPGRQGQGLAAQRGRTAALTLTTGLSLKNQANEPMLLKTDEPQTAVRIAYFSRRSTPEAGCNR